MTLKLIDVSSLQGTIDWPEVAASGIDGAIIRCVRETGAVDDLFGTNVTGARAAGLIVGAYCFIDDAIEEAQAHLFVDTVQALGGGMILAPDWERGADNVLPSITDIRAWTAIVRNAFPFQPLLMYGSPGVLSPKGNIAGWGPWWRADYGANPAGTWDEAYTARGGDDAPQWEDNALGYTRCLLWQFSSRGKVPGITGRVDLNATKLTRGELELLAGDVIASSDMALVIDPLKAQIAELIRQLEAAPGIERERIAVALGDQEADKVRAL
jgi:lysozyme